MQYLELTSNDTLNHLIELSNYSPIVVFKHSNRCAISKWVWNDFQTSNIPYHVKVFLLDVIQFRSLSNAIAEHFQIRHESPQALLIFKGTCLYHDSHQSIDALKLVEVLNT
jgi:bacillithiol system protein YtxJ